jgi:hypothetical protein
VGLDAQRDGRARPLMNQVFSPGCEVGSESGGDKGGIERSDRVCPPLTFSRGKQTCLDRHTTVVRSSKERYGLPETRRLDSRGRQARFPTTITGLQRH